jgi:hypothetical protein
MLNKGDHRTFTFLEFTSCKQRMTTSAWNRCFGIISYVACLRNAALQFGEYRLGSWHTEHLHKQALFTYPDTQRGKSHLILSAGMNVACMEM